MTKILYNGNRIIIDGHADTAEECKAITAMCDNLNASENFKTIVYESGHAVFEQVSGGESEMFVQDYVLESRYNKEVGTYDNVRTITDRLNDIEAELYNEYPDESGYEPLTLRLGKLTALVRTLEERLNDLTYIEGNEDEIVGRYLKVARFGEPYGSELFGSHYIMKLAAEELPEKPEYKLPYTADELAEKLASI